MSDDSPRKDAWDKLRSAATSLSLVAVPILVLIVGSRIDSSLKEAELRQRTVEIAVGILQEPPEAGHDSRLRDWAITVVNRYSGVPPPEDAKAELQRRALPSRALLGPTGVPIEQLLDRREPYVRTEQSIVTVGEHFSYPEIGGMVVEEILDDGGIVLDIQGSDLRLDTPVSAIGWRIGDEQWDFCNIILESTNQVSEEASIIFKCPD